ncbi:MAG: hypothetical protein QM820_44850 [Minicystis sp.]
MSRENKAFAVVIALLVGALGLESARALHRVAPRAAPESAHRLQLQPR